MPAVNKIKDLIGNDHLKEAFEHIRKLPLKATQKDEISVLSARFLDLSRKERMGTISEESYSIERSKLINSILEFLTEYENEPRSNGSGIKQKKSILFSLLSNRQAPVFILLIVILVLLIVFFRNSAEKKGIEGNNNNDNDIVIADKIERLDQSTNIGEMNIDKSTNYHAPQNTNQKNLILGVLERESNIFLKRTNGEEQLTFIGKDHFPTTPKDKSFVVFLRRSDRTLSEEEFFNGDRVSSKIVKMDLTTFQEKVIVEGCSNVDEKTKIYNGDELPVDFLCDIERPYVTPTGDRVYFNVEAWATAPAILYYEFSQNKIYYFRSGFLNGVNHQGNVVISETFTEKDRGRYVQDVLYDKNGNKLNDLYEKEF